MNDKYSKAYTEVLEIISHFNEEEYNKISKEKIDFYERNKDKEYVFKINPELDLSHQNVSKEANAILITIFRDYFATDRQKEVLNNILKKNQERIEEEKRKKYNPDQIFNREKIESKENKEIIKYKENFFSRFINFIKKIIKKSN